MSIPPAELGARIRSAREERGLSQKQLADRAGIGKTAMFDLEHGNPGVRLNTLMAVLDILGLSLRLDTPDALETLETLSAGGHSAEPHAPPPPPEPDALPSHLL